MRTSFDKKRIVRPEKFERRAARRNKQAIRSIFA